MRLTVALTVLAGMGLAQVARPVVAVALAARQDLPTVSFAAASVKVNRSGERAALTNDSVTGRFTATNVPVTQLIGSSS